MSTPLLLTVIAVIVIATFAWFKFKPTAKNFIPEDNENGLPSGLREKFVEEYERGMQPEGHEDSTFYTLITCVHCGRLKKFLKDNNIPFQTVLLDNFEGQARQNVMATIRKYNPRGSFPTLVSPTGEVTVGFREYQVRELFIKYSTTPTEETIEEKTEGN